jgi:hypothetical protein
MECLEIETKVPDVHQIPSVPYLGVFTRDPAQIGCSMHRPAAPVLCRVFRPLPRQSRFEAPHQLTVQSDAPLLSSA